ncbi:Protein jagunal like [Actinidia chinensis var. chinensis]|uniref:Protein jagunal like n=1 Tax=Actinidia chinensis var. chinensis TaxID=1590841 RepID=A0A2R6RWF4_ACTCC|nr:Protein jagunal like [Actinidia chinensis var. chinensis]
MKQRKSGVGNGRPSGTDGSDFSYRMVVDSRYTKVAKGKSRLSALIFTQAIVQLVEVVSLFLSIPQGEGLNTLAVSSIFIGFLSLLIGELGRRRSRVNLLKFYMFASSIALLISIACVGSNNFLVEVIRYRSRWEINKVEVLNIASVLLGLLVQLFSISTTVSLIRNMSPPKRAS